MGDDLAAHQQCAVAGLEAEDVIVPGDLRKDEDALRRAGQFPGGGSRLVQAFERGFDLAVEVLRLGAGGPQRTRQECGHDDKNERSSSTRGSHGWG